jgi:hypothetical protein
MLFGGEQVCKEVRGFASWASFFHGPAVEQGCVCLEGRLGSAMVTHRFMSGYRRRVTWRRGWMELGEAVGCGGIVELGSLLALGDR